MNLDLAEECGTLVTRLEFYFDSYLIPIPLKGKGDVKEVSIKTSFLLYDGTNLELRARQIDSNVIYHGMKIGEKDSKIILHDNSKLYEYLSAYGINLSSKSADQKNTGSILLL
jgi:hypothetical protein